jgi:hypothetical protein
LIITIKCELSCMFLRVKEIGRLVILVRMKEMNS